MATNCGNKKWVRQEEKMCLLLSGCWKGKQTQRREWERNRKNERERREDEREKGTRENEIVGAWKGSEGILGNVLRLNVNVDWECSQILLGASAKVEVKGRSREWWERGNANTLQGRLIRNVCYAYSSREKERERKREDSSLTPPFFTPLGGCCPSLVPLLSSLVPPMEEGRMRNKEGNRKERIFEIEERKRERENRERVPKIARGEKSWVKECRKRWVKSLEQMEQKIPEEMYQSTRKECTEGRERERGARNRKRGT